MPPPQDSDSDGDGIPNHLDRNSDGDRILDIIEAQDINSFISPPGRDLNQNGVNDAYDPEYLNARTRLPDTDGDGLPDFLDTNADGDGGNDTVEAYDFNGDEIKDVTPYGRDSNQDGIDDAFES